MTARDRDAFMIAVFGAPSHLFEQDGQDTSASDATAAAPTIAVSANGDGSFVVTGSGFVSGAAVHVRIVDDALKEIFQDTTADGGGSIKLNTGAICQLPGNLHFSANDGRPNPDDLLGTLFSNTVTASCPPGSGGGDDPDTPDDPNTPDDPAPPSDQSQSDSSAADGAAPATEDALAPSSSSGGAASAAPAGGPQPTSTGAPPADPNEPDITPEQKSEVINVEMGEYRDVYDAALQGVSGKSSDPAAATKEARAIAEEAVRTHATRIATLTQVQKDALLAEYKKFFAESIQGLSGGSNSPKTIIAKAHAMALGSLGIQAGEVERLEWKKVTLPHPQAPDCKVVHGKVPGPKNHLLCETHDHIIDTETGMVIAHSLDEYKAGKF